MEKLLFSFQESLRRLGVSKKDRLLLAISGGMDSIVLAACSFMSDLDFGIAHANFQLRGTESERDEAFVRQIADKYGKSFFSKKFDTEKYADTEKCSIQVAARKLRYDWFKTLTGSNTGLFQFLLTAHHQDDNIETMLMHFFRGTGIEGLAGMPEKKDNLVRPLLSVSRKQLEEFAQAHALRWVEDSSNAGNDYTRNYVRNKVIPSVNEVYPDFHLNMENNLRRFSEAAILYRQSIGVHKKKLLSQHGPEWHIPILLLKKSNPIRTILYEIIRDFHFTPAQTDEVIRLLDGANGKYVAGPAHRIIKNRRWLIIAPMEQTADAHIIVEENDSLLKYPGGQLRFSHVPLQESKTLSKESDTAWLDAAKIQFPLIFRKWKTGDYFYPLGMKKKKKLARFFIDQKLSKTAKEKVRVLIMDNHIIWVVGYRIDNRFCVNHSTQNILVIRDQESKIAK
jgi:tRNA(Ile)-lysidine synthase